MRKRSVESCVEEMARPTAAPTVAPTTKAPTMSPTVPCPSSGLVKPHEYCACKSGGDSECLLWGVPYYWLIFAAITGFAAVIAPWLIRIIVELCQLIINRWGNKSYGELFFSSDVIYWATMLFRLGMLWLTVLFFQLPTNVYNALRYFFSVPWFIILFPFVNAVCNAFIRVASEHMDRKHASQFSSPSASTSTSASFYQPEKEDREENPDHYSDTDEPEEQQAFVNEKTEKTNATESSGTRFKRTHALEEFLRVLKYIVFIFLFIIALQFNDIPVVAFFESASIFSLSIVFATQPWVRNLFGGLQSFFDDKFTIGDFIDVTGLKGQVIDQTLRTTTLMRDDQSTVSIPNGRLMSQPVFNFSRRKLRRVEIRLRLARDTPGAKLRMLIQKLENTLRSRHLSFVSHIDNPNKQVEASRQFFVVMDSMFDILIWTATSGQARSDKSYNKLKEDLLIFIYGILHEEGVKLASQDDPGSLASKKSESLPSSD